VVKANVHCGDHYNLRLALAALRNFARYMKSFNYLVIHLLRQDSDKSTMIRRLTGKFRELETMSSTGVYICSMTEFLNPIEEEIRKQRAVLQG
jgi:hypothetical protein